MFQRPKMMLNTQGGASPTHSSVAAHACTRPKATGSGIIAISAIVMDGFLLGNCHFMTALKRIESETMQRVRKQLCPIGLDWIARPSNLDVTVNLILQ